MAACSTCQGEMNTADSCKRINFKEYKEPRIEWTREPAQRVVSLYLHLHMGLPAFDDRCPDCNVAPGGIHHPGCDKEECPHCHKQLLTCLCDDPRFKKRSAQENLREMVKIYVHHTVNSTMYGPIVLKPGVPRDELVLAWLEEARMGGAGPAWSQVKSKHQDDLQVALGIDPDGTRAIDEVLDLLGDAADGLLPMFKAAPTQ